MFRNFKLTFILDHLSRTLYTTVYILFNLKFNIENYRQFRYFSKYILRRGRNGRQKTISRYRTLVTPDVRHVTPVARF